MPFISAKELKRLRELELKATDWLSGYSRGQLWGLSSAKANSTAHLNALDLVIDAFGLREQYPDKAGTYSLHSTLLPVAGATCITLPGGDRGAQRFYDDLIAAKEFSAKHDAFHRIQAATLTDAAIDAALDMIAATEEETE